MQMVNDSKFENFDMSCEKQENSGCERQTLTSVEPKCWPLERIQTYGKLSGSSLGMAQKFSHCFYAPGRESQKLPG